MILYQGSLILKNHGDRRGGAAGITEMKSNCELDQKEISNLENLAKFT